MESRIVVSPNIRFGEPRVKGTRITVREVLDLVAEGIPFDVVIRDYYDDLTIDDIKACVRYAAPDVPGLAATEREPGASDRPGALGPAGDRPTTHGRQLQTRRQRACS